MNRKREVGPWFLFLFGMPFAAVGIFMGWMLVRQVVGSIKASGWPEVPATIVSSELKTNSDGESTTHEAKAEYAYEFNGRKYTGTRVGWQAGADNIGSFQHQAHAKIERHRASGEPFPCRVNPANPGEAILFPDVRLGMVMFHALFLLVFGGAGFGLMIGSVLWGRLARKKQANRAASPDKPWMWNEQWRSGVVRSSSRTAFLVVAGFSVFWNAVAIPVAVIAFRQGVMGEGNRAAWLAMIFPAAGLAPIVAAAYLWRKWRKFGECVFQMASVPGVIGGALAGVVRVPVHVRPEDGFSLTLSCINRVTSGSGDSRHTSENVLWTATKRLKRELLENNPSQTALPVLFHIPYDQRQTDSSDPVSQILWRLRAFAATAGVDFAADFDVPVFVTPDSSRDFVPDESGIAVYLAPADPGKSYAEARISRVRRADGSVVFDLPAARNPGAATGLTLFWLVWTAGVVFMVRFGAPWFLPAIFGLIDVFVTIGVINSWLRTFHIEAHRHSVVVSVGLLGMGPTRVFPAAEIKDVAVSNGGSAGNTQFYDIKLRTESGRSKTIATALTDRRTADQMRIDIAQAVGIKPLETDPAS